MPLCSLSGWSELKIPRQLDDKDFKTLWMAVAKDKLNGQGPVSCLEDRASSEAMTGVSTGAFQTVSEHLKG